MNNRVFGFHSQMGVGDKGERDFVSLYPELDPVKSTDRAIDFHLNDGTSVELKTDTYKMEASNNFFMETVGSTESGKLGGPFRARQDGVNFFVYYYVNDRTFFWFKTDELCERLEKVIASGKHKVKSIKNRTWITQGYALPRSEFEDIQVRKDVFPLTS